MWPVIPKNWNRLWLVAGPISKGFCRRGGGENRAKGKVASGKLKIAQGA